MSTRVLRDEAHQEIQRVVGARIRAVREAAGKTRATLAERVGITPNMLEKIEAGKRPASMFTLLELSNRLDCAADWFLRGLLTGVHPALAAHLAQKHPELLGTGTPGPSSAPESGKSPRSTPPAH